MKSRYFQEFSKKSINFAGFFHAFSMSVDGAGARRPHARAARRRALGHGRGQALPGPEALRGHRRLSTTASHAGVECKNVGISVAISTIATTLPLGI